MLDGELAVADCLRCTDKLVQAAVEPRHSHSRTRALGDLAETCRRSVSLRRCRRKQGSIATQSQSKRETLVKRPWRIALQQGARLFLRCWCDLQGGWQRSGCEKRICLAASEQCSARNPHWCCNLGCFDIPSCVRMAAFIAGRGSTRCLKYSAVPRVPWRVGGRRSAAGRIWPRGAGHWTDQLCQGRAGQRVRRRTGESRIDFTPPSPAPARLTPCSGPRSGGAMLPSPPHKWLSAAQSERSTNSLLTVDIPVRTGCFFLPCLLPFTTCIVARAPEAVIESPSIQAPQIPNSAPQPGASDEL